MFWHPTRLDIEGWFDIKLREFVEAKNQNMKLSMGHWLDRYIHDDPHEWFFCEFPILLHDWMAKLISKKTKFQGGELTSWTLELIQELQETDNKPSQAVEAWLDSILEGYNIGFSVDNNNSFSKAEREFFTGPQERFLLSLQLVYEKGILKMDQEQWNYGVWRMQAPR